MSNIQHINPDGLMKSPAFSQVVTTEGSGKTIYIGGQNAVDAQGLIVAHSLPTQTEQVMQNITTALAACGADISHVVKLGIYMVQGQDLRSGYAAAQKFMTAPNPPVVTVLIVANLGNPDFLVEIDAIAFVPAG